MFVFLLTLPLQPRHATAFAEGTRTWEQSKFEELTKGTATGVAIRSSGGLELAPVVQAALCHAIDLHLGCGRGRCRQRLRRHRSSGASVSHHARRQSDDYLRAAGTAGAGARSRARRRDLRRHRPRRQSLQDRAQARQKRPKRRKTESKSETDKDAAKPALDPSWSSSVYFAPGTKYIWDLSPR